MNILCTFHTYSWMAMLHIYHPPIGIMVRVFTKGPGGLGFNPNLSHTKDSEKWYLIPPCLTLSLIRYGSRVNGSNSGKGIAPSPTPRCSS